MPPLHQGFNFSALKQSRFVILFLHGFSHCLHWLSLILRHFLHLCPFPSIILWQHMLTGITKQAFWRNTLSCGVCFKGIFHHSFFGGHKHTTLNNLWKFQLFGAVTLSPEELMNVLWCRPYFDCSNPNKLQWFVASSNASLFDFDSVTDGHIPLCGEGVGNWVLYWAVSFEIEADTMIVLSNYTSSNLLLREGGPGFNDPSSPCIYL